MRKSIYRLAFAGIFLMAPVLGAQTGRWQSLGLSDQIVQGVAVDPTNTSRIFAGTVAGGLQLSTDGGQTWNRSEQGFPCPSAGTVVIDPRNPLVVFALAGCPTSSGQPPTGGIMKSADGGSSWSAVYLGNCYPLVIDASTPSTLYAGNTLDCPICFDGDPTYFIRSTDSGQSWQTLTGGSQNGGFSIGTIASTPRLAYYGDNAMAFYGGFYRSTDYGTDWTRTTQDNFAVYALAVDPFDSSTILASGRYGAPGYDATQGIFRSTDAGASWVPENAGLTDPQVGSIVINPWDSTRAFAGTVTGKVFASTNAGQTWTDSSAGLTASYIATLAINPTGSVLYAGTNAGLYSLALGGSTGCAPNARTLCLANGRFQVQAQWTDFDGRSGLASVVPGATSNNSGVMWFFGPDNWELLIKVLDGCAVNGHYWVLGAAATNVAYTIQVTDTQTGEVKTYTNPLGTVSPAITDTSAFGSCP